MASLKYHKDCKKWRVFWHVTLPDGEVDKGSRSFTEKKEAQRFKDHCEQRADQLKKTVFVKGVYLDEAFTQWKTFCLGYTTDTRRLYISEVEKFIRFLSDEVIYISDLETEHIRGFLNSLLERGLVNKTVNNTLCTVKSFCKYISDNYRIANPASGIKKLKEDPPEAHFWTLEEYHEVLKNSPDTVQTWIRFIACTGLRAAEFCNLKWNNCNLKNRTVTIIGKGRKKRTIGLNNVAIGILKDAKKGRVDKLVDTVFVNSEGKSLTRYALADSIRKACRNSGLTGGGPHAARHFFATQLLIGGIPIIKVSALLGHSSITTTQRHYSHILSPDLSDVTSVLTNI